MSNRSLAITATLFTTTINASAAPPIAIELETVATGLASPVALTHASDGSERLFIVDQSGFIRIVENGVLLPAPFLDLTSKIPTLGSFFDERGVLGLAFHPDYVNNGRFFVRYSAPRAGDPAEPCNDPGGFIVGCHSEVLAEFSVSGADPNVADLASEIIHFSVDQPQFNHDGGAVAFGPDGMLYFPLGDGGAANDSLDDPTLPHGPLGNGQDIDTLLGSMIRIDVDSPPDPGLTYAIPPDNPLVGGVGRDEIYAWGFRNPFSFSFDDGPGGDGSLYVADVGQNIYEEVNIVVNGGNYGWVIREGFHCFDPFNPDVPPAACPAVGPVLNDPLLDPVMEYLQPFPCNADADCADFGVTCAANGLCDNEGGISVISGSVYRGSQNPVMVGQYTFADFSDDFIVPGGRIYHFDTTGPDAYERREFCIAPDGAPLGQFVKGMGEDEDGEVYLLASDTLGPSGSEGVVYRLTNASSEDCNSNDTADACEPDADADGTIDDCDGCPNDSQKTEAGQCGCGVSDVDSDSDGVSDCNDGCPNDPNKLNPGQCGCGVDDSLDGDADGVPDCVDICQGADDAVFAPECVNAIPAASSWSLLVFALVLLVAGKLYFGRQYADVCGGLK